MPCPHCPHCQKQEAEEAALRELLAEQVVKEEPIDVDEVIERPKQEEVLPLNDAQSPIALQITNNWKTQRLHLIEGIAGTGKTHLLNAIGSLIRNQGFHAVEVSLSQHASRSGKSIRSLITSHEEDLLGIDVILIDNVNQVSEDLIKELSERLGRVMNTGKGVMFGGKGVVMVADFGLCLPYCNDWSKQKLSSLKFFTSVPQFKKHRLPTGDSPWLQMMEEIRKSPRVVLPEKKIVDDMDKLIDFTFGELYNEVPYENSVLLAPKKIDVDFLNQEVLKRINGKIINLEAKFEGNVIRGDLDLHELRLKQDCILMLDKNYEGIPNGTRLLFQDNDRIHLNCKILDGPRRGEQVDIGRVEREQGANPKESQQWVRQFPVTLAFAMTIYGSQGRRFERVGCYKLKENFEHGMVYTALSRSKDFRVLSSDNVIPNKLASMLV